MAVISDSTLAGLANLGTKLALKDDCEILEDIEGALDALGGAEHVYLPRTDYSVYPPKSTIKCAVLGSGQTPTQEYMIAHQIVGMSTETVLFPLGTVLAKKWRFRVKGVEYKVVEPIPDESYSVFTEVVVVITTLGV